MGTRVVSIKNIKFFFAISMLALIGGYAYVSALSTGYRAFIVIHASILFFAGIAIFLRNIKIFLLLTMIIMLFLGFGWHFVFERLPFESVLFSEGIRIDTVDVILMICYIHWGLGLAGKNTVIRPIAIGGKVGIAFLGWIIYVLLSSFITATNLPYSLYEFIVYMKGFLLYFYLVNNINSEHELKIVIYALCAGCLALALYMIVQNLTKTNYTIQGVLLRGEAGPEGFRSAGFSGSPDNSAAFLVNIFPIFLVGLFLVKDMFKKTLIVVSMILTVLAVINSQVRIAQASLLVSVLILIYVTYRRRWMSKGQLVASILTGIFSLLAVIPLVYVRFATGSTGEDRYALMVTAYNMFKGNILFGVGANNYNFVVRNYIPPDLLEAWVYTVHSEYLLRLSETGILGFLFFYTFVIIVIVAFYRATFTKNPLIFIVSCGFFAAMMGSFIHRLASMYHYQQFFMLQSTIYALCALTQFYEKNPGFLKKENI
jgi:hypothetical protein